MIMSLLSRISDPPSSAKFAIIFYFRLYYLIQSPQTGSIKEETLIRVLYWACPLLASFLTTFTIAENFLFNSDDPMLFFYSYCSKRPYLTEMFSDQLFPKLSMCCMMFSLFAEMCAHMAIFVKKTKIETRAEVYEIRGARIVSRHG